MLEHTLCLKTPQHVLQFQTSCVEIGFKEQKLLTHLGSIFLTATYEADGCQKDGHQVCGSGMMRCVKSYLRLIWYSFGWIKFQNVTLWEKIINIEKSLMPNCSGRLGSTRNDFWLIMAFGCVLWLSGHFLWFSAVFMDVDCFVMDFAFFSWFGLFYGL